jgi:hypothetical protein
MSNLAKVFNNLTEEQIKRIFDPLTLIPLKEKINNHAYVALGIKTGDISEEIIKSILKSHGAVILESRQGEYDIDVYFEYNENKYFIEVKIRDDHDSTKKRGQIENFKAKQTKFKVVKSCCWFIDPLYKKNKNYYSKELKENELYYGNEIVNWLNIIFENKTINFYTDFIKQFKIIKEQEAAIFKNEDYFKNGLDIKDINIKILTYIFYYGDYEEIKETLFNNNVPVKEILNEYKTQHVAKRDKVKHVLKLLEAHLND